MEAPLTIGSKKTYCTATLQAQHPKARWQNGYVADCKSAYAGSIPARASSYQESSPYFSRVMAA